MLHRFQGRTFGGPIIQEDGAVYTPKGVQVHVLGVENPKEITKGTVIAVVAILMAIIILATFLAGKQPKDFPYERELRNYIGQSLESAAQKVGANLADMMETEEGVYKVNKRVKLDGVSFDLYFYEEEGMCIGYAYIADYKADTKKASKDIYNALVNMRIETFDKYPYYMYREDNETYDVTRKNLLAQLENENGLLVKETYLLTENNLVEPLKSFVEDLNIKRGKKIRDTVFYADKGASYDSETQRVQIILSRKIEPRREVKYY